MMSDRYDSSKIEVLSFSEAVRRRPEMYFDECFREKNLDMLPVEVACHAVDEIIDGKCTSLEILVYMDYFEVFYNSGMPLYTLPESNETAAEIIMTKLMACKNIKKHIQVGEELCKIGIASINCASEWCEVHTISENKEAKLHFCHGGIVSREIEKTDQSDLTIIKLKPDKSLFENMWFTFKGVKTKAKSLSEKINGFEIEIKSSDKNHYMK
jgi:DNA gyrase subunit B